MKKFNRFAFFFIILLVLFFIVGGKEIFQFHPEAKKEYDYLSLFSEIISLVKTDYVEEIQPEKKFPGAFTRMLDSLDKSSTYLDVSKTEMYRLYRQDKAYSCGIYGIKRSNYFHIIDIAPNSPADTYGLKPGDTIKAINGKSIFRQSFWEIYLSLLADKPETIEIVLLQNEKSSAKPKIIKLETAAINNDLTVSEIESSIYLVEIPRIDEKNAALLKQKLESELSHKKHSKLVIDLRKYSGGNLDAFIQLTTLFFPHSIPLTLKTKYNQETLLLGSPRAPSYHAVVIINKSTRMYGELLALLFKDFARENVTLVGTKTNGYISKVKQFPLKDGSSILLTEGIFLLNGKNPAKTGVTPDVRIIEKKSAKIIDRAVAILKKTHD